LGYGIGKAIICETKTLLKKRKISVFFLEHAGELCIIVLIEEGWSHIEISVFLAKEKKIVIQTNVSIDHRPARSNLIQPEPMPSIRPVPSHGCCLATAGDCRG